MSLLPIMQKALANDHDLSIPIKLQRKIEETLASLFRTIPLMSLMPIIQLTETMSQNLLAKQILNAIE